MELGQGLRDELLLVRDLLRPALLGSLIAAQHVQSGRHFDRIDELVGVVDEEARAPRLTQDELARHVVYGEALDAGKHLAELGLVKAEHGRGYMNLFVSWLVEHAFHVVLQRLVRHAEVDALRLTICRFFHVTLYLFFPGYIMEVELRACLYDALTVAFREAHEPAAHLIVKPLSHFFIIANKRIDTQHEGLLVPLGLAVYLLLVIRRMHDIDRRVVLLEQLLVALEQHLRLGEVLQLADAGKRDPREDH